MSRRQALLLLCILGVAASLTKGLVSAGGTGIEACANGSESCYESGYAGLTALQRGDATPGIAGPAATRMRRGTLWAIKGCAHILAVRSHGTVDLLQAGDSRYRGERFKRFGTINDPDCTQANGPDHGYGWITVRMKMGRGRWASRWAYQRHAPVQESEV